MGIRQLLVASYVPPPDPVLSDPISTDFGTVGGNGSVELRAETDDDGYVYWRWLLNGVSQLSYSSNFVSPPGTNNADPFYVKFTRSGDAPNTGVSENTWYSTSSTRTFGRLIPDNAGGSTFDVTIYFSTSASDGGIEASVTFPGAMNAT